MKEYAVVVVIGNSDNKLSQKDWSDFCAAVQKSLAKFTTHFYGFPPGDKPWQNALWWVQVPAADIDFLRKNLRMDCRAFGQQCIALLIGEAEFLSGGQE